VTDDPLVGRIQQSGSEFRSDSRRISAAEHEAEESAASRRFITRIILWTWVAALAAYRLTALVSAFNQAAVSVAAGLFDVIKTAVLPLTTLVLGYYMSRGK
jgi:hypothetical protein